MIRDILPSERGSVRPPARASGRFPSRPNRVVDTTSRAVDYRAAAAKVAPAPKPKVVKKIAKTPATIPSMSAAEKSQLKKRVEKMAKKANKSTNKPVKQRAVYALASLLVVATGYTIVDTWNTNNQIKTEIIAQGSSSVVADDSAQSQREGADESTVGSEVLSAYTVAPDMPKRLSIGKIDVDARVLPMGVNPNGTIQAPVNIFDSGWYDDSAKPGEIGAAFINAHASGPTRQGLFAYLDILKKGDGVELEKGDGTVLKYKVVHVETVDLEKVDMRKVLLPYGNVLKGLNLMTCSGDWVQDERTYDQRTIVYAEQVN